MTAAGTEGCIQARGLARRFGPTQAVRPFDLDVGPGGVTGLLGPNGSGKSTFLRMLLGLVRPDAGRATVDGVELTGDGTAIRRRVTSMPGESAVYGELRGAAHVEWLLRGRGQAAVDRALDIADELELPLTRRVRGYSHGMKRQLFLAAALGPDVRLRIFDEPTEGLDPSKRGEVLELLEREAARGTTILLSSHHLGEVDRTCERIVFLQAGGLLSQADPDELAARARRHLRLTFTAPPDVGDLERRLEALGAERVRLTERGAVVTLLEEDPRPFLTALAASSALPAPETLTYGELSLGELYHELYGVEGV
jgi:ABC-2 type transport system ATP-binding protein